MKVTPFLIGLNAAAYVWEIFAGGGSALSFGGGAGMQHIYEVGGLSSAAVLQDGQWWRIFTSAFLHNGLIHIGVNMISLWSLGRFIEYIAGPAKMLLIYFVSLVASGLGVVFLTSPAFANVGTVGASGAIFGLFGALFAVGLKLGKPGAELVKANIGLLVLNLIITFTVPAISWQAHLSGLVAGFLLTLAIYAPPKRVAPVVVDARTGDELETEYQSPNDPNPRSPV